MYHALENDRFPITIFSFQDTAWMKLIRFGLEGQWKITKAQFYDQAVASRTPAAWRSSTSHWMLRTSLSGSRRRADRAWRTAPCGMDQSRPREWIELMFVFSHSIALYRPRCNLFSFCLKSDTHHCDEYLRFADCWFPRNSVSRSSCLFRVRI